MRRIGDLLTESSTYNAITLDPEMASLRLRGMDDFAGLSAEDQLRFNRLITPIVNSIYRAWHLHQQALLDDGIWESFKESTPDLLGNAGVRQRWGANQHYWKADFREFVRDATSE